MTVEQYFIFCEMQQKEKCINNWYYPWKGKGRSYLIVSHDSPWGLVNYWHGGGSILEGVLEKDMTIPLRYIDDILPELPHCKGNNRGYTVCNIYGCSSDWYAGEARVIPVKQDYEKIKEKIKNEKI